MYAYGVSDNQDTGQLTAVLIQLLIVCKLKVLKYGAQLAYPAEILPTTIPDRPLEIAPSSSLSALDTSTKCNLLAPNILLRSKMLARGGTTW